MQVTSAKHGNRVFTLSCVNVFLGANGSGKSSLLNEIKSQAAQICPGRKAVYIEGGRTISLKNSLQLTMQNWQKFQDYTQALDTYEKKRQSKLSDRVYDALMVLEKKELAIKAAHSDAVHQWVSAGKTSDYPHREEPPLEKLFNLFHEIFPKLTITYNPKAKSINVQKGTAKYSIAEMSDGEKQAFSIFADFVDLTDEYGLIIVDEPELNLHPALAERIWNLIESQFPDKAYCYATHSLSFAMRPQVEKVIILSDDPLNITEIDDPSTFPSYDLHEFLGSIPGIIAARKVIVSEGNEKSFDALFYRWLLKDDQVEVVPVGDCSQVVNVCEREGIWSKIASKVKLAGVIDRDFRTDKKSSEIILQFREAESYLAIPKLAVEIDSHLSIQGSRITEDQVTDKILETLNTDRIVITANYIAAKCGIRLNISASKADVKDCKSLEDLKQKLTTSSSHELEKAESALGTAQIEKEIKDFSESIDHIIKARNWKDALRYIDGKKIGNSIAHMIGVRTATDLMRSIGANIEIALIPEVESLSSEIQSLLIQTAPTATTHATAAPLEPTGARV